MTDVLLGEEEASELAVRLHGSSAVDVYYFTIDFHFADMWQRPSQPAPGALRASR